MNLFFFSLALITKKKELILRGTLVQLQRTIHAATGQVVRIASETNARGQCSVIVEHFDQIPLFRLIDPAKRERERDRMRFKQVVLTEHRSQPHRDTCHSDRRLGRGLRNDRPS